MNLIIINKNKNVEGANGDDLLRFAVSSELIGDVLLDGLSRYLRLNEDKYTVVAVPEDWNVAQQAATPETIAYRDNVAFSFELLRKIKQNQWLIVSNGRFVTQVDCGLLYKVLLGIQADVVAVDIEPELMGRREKVRLTARGNVAGFRRLYSDSAEPAPVPADWTHHIFIKTNVLDQLAPDGILPGSFPTLLERCRSNAIRFHAVNVSGIVLDLQTADGLLNFYQVILSRSRSPKFEIQNSNVISPDSKLIGKVLLGKNIHIGPKAIVVGPTIIGNNVRISSSAVVNASVIGPEVCLSKEQFVRDCIVKASKDKGKNLTYYGNNSRQSCRRSFVLNRRQQADETFRCWPKFSYARCFKRVADVLAAIFVLILFAPVFPIIAIVIKLTSRGPVFFRDKRQGLHGKAFNCLKFRTMRVGADKIQDKLRTVSQVDGPQFKMEDDPRLCAVGSFLRDTYIDEIPQFLNVLLGQMSVIGPRPSPESENTLCPSWRDARLSVRPGITGLWQVCRTRQAMKDFQEWIHYDIKYVKNLSLRMDVWIFWQTTKNLLGNFFRRF